MIFYQCQKCLEKFNCKTDMQRHLARKNSCTKDILNKNYNKNTYKETSLYKRDKDGVVEEHKNFECNFCKKKYSSKKSLNCHIKDWCIVVRNQQIKNDTTVNNSTNIISNSTNCNNFSNNNNSNNINININKIDLRDFKEDRCDYYFQPNYMKDWIKIT